MNNRRLIGTAAAVALAACAAWLGIDLTGDPSSAPGSGTGDTSSAARSSVPSDGPSAAPEEGTCPLDTLPDQAETVVSDILAGGPFDHPAHDGKHFGNYERRLPREHNGYYREYTVDTPGLRHRGERRIITGGGTDGDPDVWYYTDDHYDSFCLIPDAEENR
ncbi:ribonuclease domain-containing protein [Corynebacterium pygosceleis]|uniref:Ribonuclease n=1 Tax=Corynebacterium pygosceleis TaxID=2800406 RepID=A0A9Q4C5A5_9CORY|nr:ribonuclease domain-containing protein [Corynebacterium pygosceleis]MCK7636553.1 ribonuclease [Corynebacterium pygosceleis]MCK7675127.1 ribonuclease [Corynebacterium pygosceleis]MCL0120671.1 ribonuclease [Corynebacterium pygosceleis]MCX7444211.1 ribonuclease [Corynebacterium pygosceleis]MCX7467306.1 ribonuclease [Corynebacterium pygosceleis]